MTTIYSNRRYVKSQQLTAHVMHIIHNIAPSNTDFRAITRELENLFYASGVEIITEADRAKAGLQPRDHNGLTIDELRAIDARFLQELLKPVASILPKDFTE